MAEVPVSELAGGQLLADVREGVGRVTLNRPGALNALSYAMLEGLTTLLSRWEADPGVRLVLLRGAGDKAFCAGGDIRELRERYLSGLDQHGRYFEVEYALDHRIHACAKPVVAVMDGITMGGGMGLAQGAALRLAGPRTRVAMPETRIGLFPDVGATAFLQRAPGMLPLYLGLTGIALGGTDSLYAGLADACWTPESLAALDAQLPAVAAAASPRRALADLGRRLAVAQGPGELEALRPAIDLHFGRDSVAGILASLAQERRPEFEPWAAKTLALLQERSPTLLCVTFEQLRRGRALALADCFRLELNLMHGCFAQGDWVEGIRALIVDKDNRPRWNPASVGEVTDAALEAFFAPRWSPHEHPLRQL